MMHFDLIVIGAGPAGTSAAVYAKSRGRSVAIIEKAKVGGIIRNVSTVTHYTAIMLKETGDSFAKRMEEQLNHAEIDVFYETVYKVHLQGDVKKIITNANTYEANAVILANGSTPRKLEIPGEDKFALKGIGLNAVRDGEKYKGKNIYVVGGADGAVKEALYLSQFTKKLTIIHFEEKLGAIAEFMNKVEAADNINVMLNSRLTAVEGKDCVTTLEITDTKTGDTRQIIDDGCGIFVYVGTIPNTMLYQELELKDGYIPVDDKMQTAISGVYAAGDICEKQVRQIATAVSDGAVAAVNAAAYLARR